MQDIFAVNYCAIPFLPTVDRPVSPLIWGVQRNPRAVILYFYFRCPAASTQTRAARYRETKSDTPEQRRAHPELAGFRLFPRLLAAPKSPPERAPHPAQGTHNPAIFP